MEFQIINKEKIENMNKKENKEKKIKKR